MIRHVEPARGASDRQNRDGLASIAIMVVAVVLIAFVVYKLVA